MLQFLQILLHDGTIVDLFCVDEVVLRALCAKAHTALQQPFCILASPDFNHPRRSTSRGIRQQTDGATALLRQNQ